MVVKTPSGYEVFIKESLTFRQKRELERMFVSGSKVNPSKVEDATFDSDLIFKVQDKAFEILVEKVMVGGVEVTGNKLETVMDWQEKDANEVFDKINSIAGLKTPSAKETQEEKKM